MIWSYNLKIVRLGIDFLKSIIVNRHQVYELTKRDFKQKYMGSFLGIFWAFLEPLALMMIMWFVFAVGFKRGALPDGVPFISYFFIGFVAYNLFDTTLSSASGVIRSYSFLIEKVNFRISILPLIKVLSSLILHVILLTIVIAINWINGYSPSLYWLQLVYYLFSACFFIIGMSWLLSSIGIFLKDITHIVSIFLRFGFWLTPIFWSIETIPVKYQKIFIMNPIYYIVKGYRDAFVYHNSIFNDWPIAIYYWSVSIIVLIVGIIVFIKLRPHFADVV